MTDAKLKELIKAYAEIQATYDAVDAELGERKAALKEEISEIVVGMGQTWSDGEHRVLFNKGRESRPVDHKALDTIQQELGEVRSTLAKITDLAREGKVSTGDQVWRMTEVTDKITELIVRLMNVREHKTGKPYTTIKL